MLNFKNTNIVFAMALAGLIVFDVLYNLPTYSYILLAIAYSLLLFYGSYFVQSQFYMKTVCDVDMKEKKIAITFDDGPQQNFTPHILDILKEADVKATFFCIGKNAEANKNLLKQIYNEGHTIGSHSYTHGFWFDLLSAKAMHKDLQQLHEFVKDELGIEIKWFRPPYGVTTPNLKIAVDKMNYTAIGWNVRSMDTVSKNEVELLKKLKRSLKPGGIFLFHDTAAITVRVLPEFINYAGQQGYEIEPLNKLLNVSPYADR
ncbi:polysaccharide deacetylase family protein [Niabella ginsengisoli]|uniref:Polysaccharide deacetylase family protein n=1 Tax=Niabella ginsengisoli TaxID=522298 RepID=A0ABS9SNF5_9BACT|nr:polysaccharide deacetylase family protein [Niabella ginsengisoli]MCH5599875.1 polysaccharide deacetylase family protein [Niabella ginsengisoli]